MLPMELEVQRGMQRADGTGSESRPGGMCAAVAADGCELVSLHSSALCMGQLAWRSLQQAAFFRQEVASFSYGEMVMIGSQFITQNWKQAGSLSFYFSKTGHLYKPIKKPQLLGLIGVK